jgi:hypothetical protein
MQIWRSLKNKLFALVGKNLNDKYNNHANIRPSQKTDTMALNYQVGGNEIKVDANEAINEIQHNKTMLVSQLTSEEPIQPEAIAGLTTIDEVFRQFKPTVEVAMTNIEGVSVNETMKFGKLDDFTPKGIIRQSEFLNKMKIQQEQYGKIMKQLKSNKVLQTMLANPETKEALIDVLRNVASELEAKK